VDCIVVVKVVPSLEAVRYDPERRTMQREGTEQFLNPFDQRALRVALDLRRPTESVVVVSMGPPSAELALKDALALGADRSILITDPRLAGSDTLVTARALSHAIARLPHDLILAGKWTTDSETGQVPPELAALLDIPFLSSARRLSRSEDGLFDMDGDTDEGFVHYRFRPPAVVGIGEKITKIRRPTEEELRSTASKMVERWTLEDIQLDPALAGLAGSPTVVDQLRDDEPTRVPRLWVEGSATDRAGRAVSEVVRLLGELAPERSTEGHAGLTDGSADKEIVVLVTGREGRSEPVARSILSEVRSGLRPYWPSAIWVGPSPTEADLEQLASAGAVRAHVIVTGVGSVGSRAVAAAVRYLLGRSPQVAGAIFLSNTFGREVAGQVAGPLGLGLTGDVVGMTMGPDGGIRWEKPAFGGGIIATISSRTRPHLATVRPGAFHPAPHRPTGVPLPVDLQSFSAPPSSIEVGKEVIEADSRYGQLADARILISIGSGIGSPERLAEILPIAERLGAAVGATRRVVDQGWVPRQLQIGLTGTWVAPQLAILVGVRGSTNHMVGLRRARVLVGINPDPTAELFQHVDVGLVGKWEELLPALADALVGHGLVGGTRS
jgi:electron transfer flavoprotein alpha subunit